MRAGSAGTAPPTTTWAGYGPLTTPSPVGELLSHTAGAGSPPLAALFADSVPGLATLVRPVLRCTGPRGEFRPSNGGYAVLGQLIADATASPYGDAVTRLVLEPPGMSGSSFPARPADPGPGAVTATTSRPRAPSCRFRHDLHRSRRPRPVGDRGRPQRVALLGGCGVWAAGLGTATYRLLATRMFGQAENGGR